MGWTSDQYVLKVNFYSVPKTNIMCYFKEHIVFLLIWPCADLWVHWSAAVLCTQLSVNIAINIDVLLQMDERRECLCILSKKWKEGVGLLILIYTPLSTTYTHYITSLSQETRDTGRKRNVLISTWLGTVLPRHIS